jgi:hypothetical protein
VSGKGGEFERYVSKYLTEWLTGKTKPYMFWRMPASGGLATIHEECVGLSGDIRAVSKDAEFFTERFCVECKTGYPHTSFWQFFKRTKGFSIEKFWKQTIDEAGDKDPMLIYRKKGNKPLVGLGSLTLGYLQKNVPIYNLRMVIIDWGDLEELPPIHLMDMEEFFNLVKPDDVKKMGE